jgi:hypothetical protein
VQYRTNENGNMRNKILIENQETNQIWIESQKEENILLHIKDLMESPPLSNLLIEEESRSMDSQDEPTCTFEIWFVEYIDKSFQVDEIIPTNKEI